jgi:hypothetical protein
MRRQHHADDESENRPQVSERGRELSFRAVDGAEDDVRGLHVGEHAAARQIGVGVEESIGQREEQGEPQASRSLGVRRAGRRCTHPDNVTDELASWLRVR